MAQLKGTISADPGSQVISDNVLHDDVLPASLPVNKVYDAGMIQQPAYPVFILIVIQNNGII